MVKVEIQFTVMQDLKPHRKVIHVDLAQLPRNNERMFLVDAKGTEYKLVCKEIQHKVLWEPGEGYVHSAVMFAACLEFANSKTFYDR